MTEIPLKAQAWTRNTAAFLLACLAGIGASALVFGPSLKLPARGVTDFISLYTGARLARTPELYTSERMIQVQRESAGWSSHRRLYCRPPFYALLLKPLAALPYIQAHWLWEALLVVPLALFIALWRTSERRVTALAVCWSLPVFAALAQGQDVPFVLAFAAIAVMLEARGRPFAAGCVFGLCAIKFHLFLLLPVLVIAQRRWRFAAGLLACGAALVGLSFLAAGPHWPAEYLRLLRDPGASTNPEDMPNLHGLFAGWKWSGYLEAGGFAVIAAAVWIAARGRSFSYGMAGVLAGGLLVAPHDYMADCALLIPAALAILAATEIRWQRAISLGVLLPVCYVPMLMGPLIAVTRWALIAFVLGLAAAGLRSGRRASGYPDPRERAVS